MREIKFRAWSKTYKKMFFEDTFKCALAGMINIAKIHLGRCDIKGGIYLPVDDKKLIFMQYTGIKDKNDKEIYEGDIVKLPMCEDRLRIVERGKVNYHLKGFRKGDRYNIEFSEWCNPCEFEVIGNIYEKPELLKV